jgi:hypothetical protein
MWPPPQQFFKSLWNLVYIYHATWSHLNRVIHKSLRSVISHIETPGIIGVIPLILLEFLNRSSWCVMSSQRHTSWIIPISNTNTTAFQTVFFCWLHSVVFLLVVSLAEITVKGKGAISSSQTFLYYISHAASMYVPRMSCPTYHMTTYKYIAYRYPQPVTGIAFFTSRELSLDYHSRFVIINILM